MTDPNEFQKKSQSEIDILLREFLIIVSGYISSNEIPADSPVLSPSYILRYLRAMKFDIKRAVILWKRSLDFRLNVAKIPFNVPRLVLTDFMPVLLGGFITIPRGMCDKNGRQILIVRPRFMDPYKLERVKLFQ
ncbi:hypothetical protein HK096_005481, partial [Nowakowskiella sp. JEL0078]